MKVGSLFSGIGGFDLGLERAGMEIAWQAELDPYCSRVLAHHWPGVKNYGDVRNLSRGHLERGCRPDDGLQWAGGAGCLGEPAGGCVPVEDSAIAGGGRREAGTGLLSGVDLICGGFPCQDVSVAGKRAGLDGERSGLWFEFQRVLSELRPRWALIENVPGLLSSNSGRDFAVILDGLGECGFGGIAWAVLDSQHFGVAQRRRRVFIVCGPTRRGVEQVLSLCESCGGNPAPRRETGEDVAATIRGRSSGAGVNEPGRGGEDDSNLVLANALPGHHPRQDLDNDTYVPTLAATLASEMYHHGGYPNQSLNGDNGFLVAHRLRADGFDASEDGTGRGTPLVAFQQNTRDEVRLMGGDGRYTGALSAEPGMKNYIAGVSVRRLTPTECARLQGFPDDWCDLPGAADGPKYRAYGNAVTVPVIEYLGRRLMAVLA